jgi:alpha-aminoadipate carrier protein LysW
MKVRSFAALRMTLLSNIRRKRSMTHCPECEASITLQGLMVGEIIYCPDCNAELEVLNLEQPAVALAPEVEEDWGE